MAQWRPSAYGWTMILLIGVILFTAVQAGLRHGDQIAAAPKVVAEVGR